jgi:hypothetical protein
MLALHVVIYVWVWRVFVPINRTDFAAFFAATRLWEQGSNVYDLTAQCNIVEPITERGCLPMAHPPVLLPLMSLLIGENYVASYWRWGALLSFVVALCLIPLYSLSPDLNAAIVALVFTPTFISVFLGQDTAFILLGVLLCVMCFTAKRDLFAGLALGLTMVKPQIAIQLGLPLLFCRRRAFVGFAVAAFTLIVWSWLLVGTNGLKSLVEVLIVLSKGQGYGIKQEEMASVTGLLAIAGINTKWAWVVFLVAIPGISLLWRRYGLSKESFALAVVIAVFASPHLHRQDLALLALPLVVSHRMAPAGAALVLLGAFVYGLFQLEAFLLLFILAIWLDSRLRKQTIEVGFEVSPSLPKR